MRIFNFALGIQREATLTWLLRAMADPSYLRWLAF